jgi:hypothetical protein
MTSEHISTAPTLTVSRLQVSNSLLNMQHKNRGILRSVFYAVHAEAIQQGQTTISAVRLPNKRNMKR